MQRAPQGPEYYASRQLGPVGNELDVDFPLHRPSGKVSKAASVPLMVALSMLKVNEPWALVRWVSSLKALASGEVATRDTGCGIDQHGIGGGADGSTLPQHADVDGGSAAQVVQGAAQLLGLQREVGGAGITP